MIMSDAPLTPQQLEQLLQYAGRRLGTSPEQLKQAVEQHGLAGLTDKLPANEAAQAQALLGDREKATRLLQDPRVQQLLTRLLGDQ